MPRHNTPKLNIGYGWLLGEHPGTEALDEFRLHFDAMMQENFAYNPLLSNGLLYQHRGAVLLLVNGSTVRIPPGYITLQSNSTNYIFRDNAGIVYTNTTSFPAGMTPLGIATTSMTQITEQVDMRPSNVPASGVQYISNSSLIPSGNLQEVVTKIIDYLSTTLMNIRRTFVYEQFTPSAFWNVHHNLLTTPEVNLVDMQGNRFYAEVDYVDLNNITVTLTEPQTGRAFLTYSLGNGNPIFEQLNPALIWYIPHTMGGNPNVLLVDLVGNEIHGEVDYPDSQTVVVTWGSPQSGRAYLS